MSQMVESKFRAYRLMGVARASALQSRTSQGEDADAARVRALAAYGDFLTLWKDADPKPDFFRRL